MTATQSAELLRLVDEGWDSIAAYGKVHGIDLPRSNFRHRRMLPSAQAATKPKPKEPARFADHSCLSHEAAHFTLAAAAGMRPVSMRLHDRGGECLIDGLLSASAWRCLSTVLAGACFSPGPINTALRDSGEGEGSDLVESAALIEDFCGLRLLYDGHTDISAALNGPELRAMADEIRPWLHRHSAAVEMVAAELAQTGVVDDAAAIILRGRVLSMCETYPRFAQSWPVAKMRLSALENRLNSARASAFGTRRHRWALEDLKSEQREYAACCRDHHRRRLQGLGIN